LADCAKTLSFLIATLLNEIKQPAKLIRRITEVLGKYLVFSCAQPCRASKSALKK
jgi:hypothetical protein